MEALTWTGNIGGLLNPILGISLVFLLVAIMLQLISGLFIPAARGFDANGSLIKHPFTAKINLAVLISFCVLIGISSLYLIVGVIFGLEGGGIIGGISKQLTPVWLTLFLIFGFSVAFKRKLGLYGKLFDSPVGMIGLGLILFWVLVAIFGGMFDMIVTHNELSQVSGMKNKLPGTPMRGADGTDFQYFLLGGDGLARDVFSRAVKGSAIVIVVAPLATLFAFMVGITLGIPAGYYSDPILKFGNSAFLIACILGALFISLVTFLGAALDIVILLILMVALILWLLVKSSLDTVLSFLANLILAFPVILLFFLLVTPEIVKTGLPNYMALILFFFPVIFLAVLLNSKYHTRPDVHLWIVGGVTVLSMWVYLSMISEPDTAIHILPIPLDFISMPPEILVVFVSVVFVNSPTVFRIVRGLTLDIKSRDYVAAAQTRGERGWYIMLWEILPNVRGPLIVDFCLRIGYTTILLGTLGFFGLGLESESPDWGTTINAGRRLLSVAPIPALVPAIALMSLVLGLNLLADGLREESLRD